MDSHRYHQTAPPPPSIGDPGVSHLPLPLHSPRPDAILRGAHPRGCREDVRHAGGDRDPGAQGRRAAGRATRGSSGRRGNAGCQLDGGVVSPLSMGSASESHAGGLRDTSLKPPAVSVGPSPCPWSPVRSSVICTSAPKPRHACINHLICVGVWAIRFPTQISSAECGGRWGFGAWRCCGQRRRRSVVQPPAGGGGSRRAAGALSAAKQRAAAVRCGSHVQVRVKRVRVDPRVRGYPGRSREGQRAAAVQCGSHVQVRVRRMRGDPRVRVFSRGLAVAMPEGNATQQNSAIATCRYRAREVLRPGLSGGAAGA